MYRHDFFRLSRMNFETAQVNCEPAPPALWQMEFDRDVSILPLKDAELRCGKTIESREGSCVPYGHTNSVHAANK